MNSIENSLSAKTTSLLLSAALLSFSFAPANSLAQNGVAITRPGSVLDGSEVNISTLNRAAISNNASLIKALLDAGVNPNEREERMPERSALAFALETCEPNEASPGAREKSVEYLLAAGADPNAISIGKTPVLIWAAQKCSGAVMGRLVKAGANFDAKSPQGYNALSMALTVSNVSAARALLAAGARLKPQVAANLLDNDDVTAEVRSLTGEASGVSLNPGKDSKPKP